MKLKIKEIRAKMGLSQSKLAADLGIGRTAYQSYELGVRGLPPRIAEKILAKALMDDIPCSLDYIYGLKSKPPGQLRHNNK